MDKQLINAYAHGNLQRSLLLMIVADQIKTVATDRSLEVGSDLNLNLQKQLDLWTPRLVGFLKRADYPQDDPDSEAIRAESILLAHRFVEDLRDILLPDLVQ